MTEPKKSIIAPTIHRMEGDLRVCDVEKVGRADELYTMRVQRMATELTEGFEFLKKYKLGATFFGSARCAVGEESYTAASELAKKLSESGFAIITGGAGGIMEAANRGAMEAQGDSIGLNIQLPHEQGTNEFVTESMDFNYFFTRKVMLTFASELYIYFPGGFGTLDELFEILTLVQTKKIKQIPIILYGKDHWTPLTNFIDTTLKAHGLISPEDTDLYIVVDSVEEAYKAALDMVQC